MMTLSAYLLVFAVWVVYLIYQVTGIYAGDSGDLVTAAFVAGVPHPPGYPLYTFIAHLVSKIPLFTVAWRVTLLSSVPHALVAAGVFLIVRYLTRSKAAGLFAALFLAGNYLFFLYSITPEVFAVLNLFLVILMFMVIRMLNEPGYFPVTAFLFVAGLSLTHHHIILLGVPGFLYALYVTVKKRTGKKKLPGIPALRTAIFAFLAGLVPYLYVPLAARRDPIINWDRAVNPGQFIRLITRADYGTFLSAPAYGESLKERFISVRAFLSFLADDMTVIGLALSALGVWYAFRFNRKIGMYLLITIVCFGPFFLFYASFPLVSNFMLGTFERFLLPSVVILSVCAGLGVHFLVTQAASVISRTNILSKSMRPFAAYGLMFVLFIHPTSQYAVSAWRFWGLNTDKTTQSLSRDVLDSVPEGPAILLLSRDTVLFTAQYERYVEGYRQDVALLMRNFIENRQYQQTFARVFPHISVPQTEQGRFLPEFIAQNLDTYPIFTNTETPIEGVAFIPHGLLYRVVSSDQTSTLSRVRDVNRELWESYSEPQAGILSRYNHLMLSDVRDVYASAVINTGTRFLKNGLTDEALIYFRRAVSYGSDASSSLAYMNLGIAEAMLGKCEASLDAFSLSRDTAYYRDPKLYLYESFVYRDCLHDEKTAGELKALYERESGPDELRLEAL